MGPSGRGELAAAVFVNRWDQPFRAPNGLANLTVQAQNGTVMYGPYRLTSDYVQPFQLTPFNPSALPDLNSAFQTSAVNRRLKPRFVSVSFPATAAINIREIVVLDSTATNVAYQKAVTTTGNVLLGGSAQVVDGSFDYDTLQISSPSLLSLQANGSVAPSLTIDLGAIYDLSVILIFWDRYFAPSAAGTLTVLK